MSIGSIGSIGIQALTGSSGTPQQASSDASDRKIDTSADSTTAAAVGSEGTPPPGMGKFIDRSV